MDSNSLVLSFLLSFKFTEAATGGFYKKAVLKNFAIFTGKHLCWIVFFLIKVQISETPRQLFPCEYCEIFTKTYLQEHLRTTASRLCL